MAGPKHVQGVGCDAVGRYGGTCGKDAVRTHTVRAASSGGGLEGVGERRWEAGVEAG